MIDRDKLACALDNALVGSVWQPPQCSSKFRVVQIYSDYESWGIFFVFLKEEIGSFEIRVALTWLLENGQRFDD